MVILKSLARITCAICNCYLYSTSDDPYSNPDQSAANDLEPPNYDYSGISPTAGFDDLSPMPDYGSYQNDPCAVSSVQFTCGIVKICMH